MHMVKPKPLKEQRGFAFAGVCVGGGGHGFEIFCWGTFDKRTRSSSPLFVWQQDGGMGGGDEPIVRQGKMGIDELPWVWRVWRQPPFYEDSGRRELTEVVSTTGTTGTPRTVVSLPKLGTIF
jgi:hypothetical protein